MDVVNKKIYEVIGALNYLSKIAYRRFLTDDHAKLLEKHRNKLLEDVKQGKVSSESIHLYIASFIDRIRVSSHSMIQTAFEDYNDAIGFMGVMRDKFNAKELEDMINRYAKKHGFKNIFDLYLTYGVYLIIKAFYEVSKGTLTIMNVPFPFDGIIYETSIKNALRIICRYFIDELVLYEAYKLTEDEVLKLKTYEDITEVFKKAVSSVERGVKAYAMTELFTDVIFNNFKEMENFIRGLEEKFPMNDIIDTIEQLGKMISKTHDVKITDYSLSMNMKILTAIYLLSKTRKELGI